MGASSRLPVVVSWIVLLLAVAVGVAPLVAPAPPPSIPDVSDFSVAHALDHIERIARGPRPIGTLGNQRGREYIVAELRMLGLKPELQTIEVPNYFSVAGESIEVVNVIARIPGMAPTKAVALVGHYDTVPSTLGANDDASALAIMLETARAILAGQRLRNDVILVFTDGEEPAPRFGSSAFIAEHPWAGGIWTVLAGWRDAMGVAESYLYLVCLLVLTAGIGIAMTRLTRRLIGTGPDAIGVVAVWWVLGLLTTIVAPGMSYLFVWPALAGGLTLLWRSPPTAGRWWQFAGLMLVSGTTLVLLVPAVDTFYQLAQPRPGNPDSQILSIIAILVLLLALVVELLRAFWVRPLKRSASVRQTARLKEC